MRLFFKLFRAVLAVICFAVVYKETNMVYRNYVFAIWLLFLLFSFII